MYLKMIQDVYLKRFCIFKTIQDVFKTIRDVFKRFMKYPTSIRFPAVREETIQEVYKTIYDVSTFKTCRTGILGLVLGTICIIRM